MMTGNNKEDTTKRGGVILLLYCSHYCATTFTTPTQKNFHIPGFRL